MAWGDNRGAMWNWHHELGAGRVRLGGPWFLTVSAWRRDVGSTPYIRLACWREVNPPQSSPVRAGRQHVHLPLDAIPALLPMLQAAVDQARSTWWVEEPVPHRAASRGS